jgi:hypothetical protein
MPLRLRRSSKKTTRIPSSSQNRKIDHAFAAGPHYSGGMLFLAAFNRLCTPREQEAEGNDLVAQSHAALGHLGLTVIALVFVLITFWKS